MSDGIVEFTRDGEHIGMGALVGPCHVLTCAHVVNVALGERPNKSARPDDIVAMNFISPHRSSPFIGVVEKWLFPETDLALVRVKEWKQTPGVEFIPPENIVEIEFPLSIVGSTNTLSVFGIGEYERDIGESNVTIGVHIEEKYLQLNYNSGRKIVPGFSGAPVLKAGTNTAVGIVCLARDDEPVAKMIPTSVILEAEILPAPEPPPVNELSPVLRTILAGYGIALIVVASLSLFLSYSNLIATAPFAWTLQFGHPFGNTTDTIPIGAWNEWFLTLLLVGVSFLYCRFICIREVNGLAQALANPIQACRKCQWLVVAILIFGIGLSLRAAWTVWLYHKVEAPEKLQGWVAAAIEGKTRPKNGQVDPNGHQITNGEITKLQQERDDPQHLDSYRSCYFRYLPYSLVNFVFIAVPLCCLFLYGLLYDLGEALLLFDSIRNPRTARHQVTRLFSQFRNACVQTVSRAMTVMALFAIPSVFFSLFQNLAALAVQHAVWASLVIFVGPFVSTCAFVLYGYGFSEATRKIGDDRLHRHRNAMTAAVMESWPAAVGTVIYVGSVLWFVFRW